MSAASFEALVRRRLADEVGRCPKEAPTTVAMLYPSPYGAGMSSLGFQRIYRAINDMPGFACERVFLDDEAEQDLSVQARPRTYESLRPLEEFPIVAVSVAYELEIAGLVRMLDAANIPAHRTQRDERHPFILAGGPLTFSNPLPLAGIVDAIIVGESEELIEPVLDVLRSEATEGAPSSSSRARTLERLAAIPHVFVPAHHGVNLPVVAKVDNALLPAWSPIRTPHSVLSNMFLIETERGCSRTCTYCVMRRSTNGGMRLVSMDRILETIPEDARRVGLVGAAVSDHPRITQIVNALADRGAEVGLSSLRPDRLNDDFVAALKRGGYKTLTTAMDGPSDRLRESLERRARVKNLLRAAELAKAHKMERLKLYLMVGLPNETDADIDECITFSTELSRIVPLSLGIAPFCAKRNTPLDGKPFAGIKVVQDRLERLRRGLKGRVDVRSTSAKWAWVEYVLAQGSEAEGLAVIDAVREGGRFADYKRAFASLPAPTTAKPRRSLAIAQV
ncbi:B12-binding domain-containing radical SAM protein [Pendulispora brunnea]|uniref:B12-binding domain-containing radical SAM protein n=1 Tax=Pendulispora brunnea TaxID=2905690 RepID=A0ABZ2K8Z5_9BACT